MGGSVIAYHIVVSGRVQGVGYRWFTQRLAEAYGIAGYVRNLPDGRVEVLAQAEKDVLDAFCDKLREGPSFSTTNDFSLDKIPVDPALHAFDIRF